MDGNAELGHPRMVQDGVLRRVQLEQAGLSAADIQRLLRRRELRRALPGVYVDHTGPLTWTQRAWVAVLSCWPAALAGESVWRETPLVHVAVAHERRISAPAGVRVHRMRSFDDRVRWQLAPPRLRVEDAVLDVAGTARDDFAAIAAVSDVVQRRLTTYCAIRRVLAERSRSPRGAWLHRTLDDLSAGANSVLELEYLRRVERAHGLPPAHRQARGRAGERRVERDVAYPRYGVVVELVGRAFHDDVRSWDLDLDRDLAAAVEDDVRTIRLGWGQVLRHACRTAPRIGVLLRRGGWDGRLARCPECP